MDRGAESYEKYRSGQDEGFYELVREYSDGLTMYINGIVGDFFRAEELADDTFFKLAVKKPAFRGASSFRTWLYSIGRNVALDSLRRDRTPPHEQIDEDAAAPDDPESSYIEDETKRQLYRAMDRLRPEYREVLWLSFFEDMKADQISTLLHKSKNNVHQLILRAKRALKDELEQEGFVYEGQ
ncbi:MAG: RNA polymerase sigma factor [Clostridia bacterium]|nr:RNA polymerase sigma factor [Clostridia bacterium]